MVTIEQIAEKANISRSSVAKILRGYPGFNEKTRERVQRIARELQYRPNYLSKALAGGKSMSIGVLFFGAERAGGLSKVMAVVERARQDGYIPYIIAAPTDKPAQAIASIQNLLDRRVDGLIIDCGGVLHDDVVSMLKSVRTPLVYMDRAPRGSERAVIIQREPAIQQAADHLAALGHRQAAVVCSPSDLLFPQLRLDSFRKSFADRGINLIADKAWWMRSTKDYRPQAYELVRRAMQRSDRPTLLVMNNDELAQAAIAAVRDLGKAVPDDVSVLGFDNLPIGQYLRPSLTTIRQPREAVGRRAFDMLASLIAEPKQIVEPVHMDCELVVRESTGPCPRAS